MHRRSGARNVGPQVLLHPNSQQTLSATQNYGRVDSFGGVDVSDGAGPFNRNQLAPIGLPNSAYHIHHGYVPVTSPQSGHSQQSFGAANDAIAGFAGQNAYHQSQDFGGAFSALQASQPSDLTINPPVPNSRYYTPHAASDNPSSKHWMLPLRFPETYSCSTDSTGVHAIEQPTLCPRINETPSTGRLMQTRNCPYPERMRRTSLLSTSSKTLVYTIRDASIKMLGRIDCWQAPDEQRSGKG